MGKMKTHFLCYIILLSRHMSLIDASCQCAEYEELVNFAHSEQFEASNSLSDSNRPRHSYANDIGWIAGESEGAYIGIDLLEDRLIKAIVTWGHRFEDRYVSSFFIKYRLDKDEACLNEFKHNLLARYVRVYPVEFESDFPALRWELFGCKDQTIPTINGGASAAKALCIPGECLPSQANKINFQLALPSISVNRTFVKVIVAGGGIQCHADHIRMGVQKSSTGCNVYYKECMIQGETDDGTCQLSCPIIGHDDKHMDTLLLVDGDSVICDISTEFLAAPMWAPGRTVMNFANYLELLSSVLDIGFVPQPK
ncbi:hypothetical protein CAPTEDRAFT_210793 [Capitella teleta]|uniref:F5/8 type C domain-containing protein n=1 Tax=Capitella teleta TaxID=283909 RepID=R7U1I4_CAPTE|nr:hypothetical protein CAPTEDRAFT_210793 [Capitella teleta]|eukprot:ELT99809.1 hypothetical protein CAPTEDRAFT_210793 [Capitella teleta]